MVTFGMLLVVGVLMGMFLVSLGVRVAGMIAYGIAQFVFALARLGMWSLGLVAILFVLWVVL